MRLLDQQIRKRLTEGIWCQVPTRRLRVLLVLLGLTVLFSRYVPAWNSVWDYSVYYEASRSMLEGKSPYVQPELFTPEKPYAGLPYLYSPLFARFLTPLALLNYMWSTLAWVILKCFCLEACVFLVMRLLGLPFSAGAFVLSHFLVLFYEPIVLDVASGNVATLEIMTILSGLLAWRSHRPILGGFLLTMPITVKPTCLLILLYALHRRAWDVLRGAGLAVLLVGLCTVPDWRYAADLLQYFRSPLWARFWDELVQGYYNFSAVTVIQRIFGETYFTDPIVRLSWLPPILIPLASISILILTAWATVRSEGGSRTAPTKKLVRDDSYIFDHNIFSLVLLTALLLPPRLAGYSLVWTLLPLASLTYRTLAEHDWLVGFLTAAGFVLIQIHVEPQHVKPGVSQLLIDHYFFGLLFLYAANVRSVIKYKG